MLYQNIKPKLYLDTCCYNRPFDDQEQDKIRIEAEAVLSIIARGELGQLDILKSGVIFDEILAIPYPDKQSKVLNLYGSASPSLSYHQVIGDLALDFHQKGLGAYDATHLAYAKHYHADVLLTTDRKFINTVRNLDLDIPVLNPLTYMTEVL